ncbi:hypothetical protein, partial [Desulfoluna sp.]|uniref:hypothetical protein n=1 Tax=Desulfoluna sp. TaxID=2045199 RepID=UPI00262E3F3D
MRYPVQKNAWFTLTSCFLFILATISCSFADTTPSLKLSVLCDDTSVSEMFATEHGVSIYIELANGHHWLMDTGTTDIYLQNAQRLNISLQD